MKESESCAAGTSGQCTARATPSSLSKTEKDFWSLMKENGFKHNLKRKTVQDGESNRTVIVLRDDVFYGRAIIKIPRAALISIETARNSEFRHELQRFIFEDKVLEKKYNVTSENTQHLLSLAYPLIVESRDPDSVFRSWLDAVEDARMPVLELSQEQLRALANTTVDGTHEEMMNSVDVIERTASNISIFHGRPVTRLEAKWALAVIMRHARIVHPHQDVRDTRSPRMYLFPIKEMLDMRINPDYTKAITFQEEITLDGKREEEVVVQIARRDMAKGEEVFTFPGRLSNSEMAMRHGVTFSLNHVGIGRNITQPPNWNDNERSKVRKELNRYNCSSLDAFEMRFDTKGRPMRTFVRCFRVSWLLSNGWYSPAYRKRLLDLNRWPPPAKYKTEDWLAMTQVDQELNSNMLGYCKHARAQLKESIDISTAQDFRTSKDPLDQLVWNVRSEESKTFKACIKLAEEVNR